MAISWNEIKHRAMEFSREWADESREQAEAKSFWDGFFHVFGISRRRVASFEEPVKKLDESFDEFPYCKPTPVLIECLNCNLLA